MAKLTEKERSGFEQIMKEDLVAINSTLMNQIKDFWAKAREEVLKRKQWDLLIKEKRELEAKQVEIKNRIHEIAGLIKNQDLKPEQVIELGGKCDDFGSFKGANFYGIPVVGQFDYEIVEFIRKHINLEVPVKFLYDLGRSCIRELTMSGTFEEAREAYQKFYSMDFRKYGVDIPPRLDDAQKEKEMLSMSKEVLSLPVDLQNQENKQGEVFEHESEGNNQPNS